MKLNTTIKDGDYVNTKEGYKCPYCRRIDGLDEYCMFRFLRSFKPILESFGQHDKTIILYSGIHKSVVPMDLLLYCLAKISNKNFLFLSDSLDTVDRIQSVMNSFYSQPNSFLLVDSESLFDGIDLAFITNIICIHSFVNPYLYEHLLGRCMRPERLISLKVFYFHNK